mgnify:FL=1
MSKRKKYDIAGSVVWVFITWILGNDQLELVFEWWRDSDDGINQTLVAIIFGWIVVWVLCWAFVKGKDK